MMPLSLTVNTCPHKGVNLPIGRPQFDPIMHGRGTIAGSLTTFPSNLVSHPPVRNTNWRPNRPLWESSTGAASKRRSTRSPPEARWFHRCEPRPGRWIPTCPSRLAGWPSRTDCRLGATPAEGGMAVHIPNPPGAIPGTEKGGSLRSRPPLPARRSRPGGRGAITSRTTT